MRGGEAIGPTFSEGVHPLHRHADARLILFVAGAYLERAIGEIAIFEPGDFIVRPWHYAHDGQGCGARYIQLKFRAKTALAFFSTHGWRARRGKCPGDWRDAEAAAHDPATGDALLAHARTYPLEPPPHTDMGEIASALSRTDSSSLSNLAERHNMRPWELTRRFTRTYGLSPLHFRLQARIQNAVRLIAETQMPLAEIAACAGFADQSHLGRALQREIGLTPDKLRRQIALA